MRIATDLRQVCSETCIVDCTEMSRTERIVACRTESMLDVVKADEAVRPVFEARKHVLRLKHDEIRSAPLR